MNYGFLSKWFNFIGILLRLKLSNLWIHLPGIDVFLRNQTLYTSNWNMFFLFWKYDGEPKLTEIWSKKKIQDSPYCGQSDVLLCQIWPPCVVSVGWDELLLTKLIFRDINTIARQKDRTAIFSWNIFFFRLLLYHIPTKISYCMWSYHPWGIWEIRLFEMATIFCSKNTKIA